MKKVYLKCCLNKNLGDDLFLKVITDRYKEKFITISRLKYNNDIYNDNLTIKYIKYSYFRNIDRISRIILHTNNILEKYYINKCDLIIEVGGSIFMESKKKSRKLPSLWYQRLNRPYYIIGANIGPYYTEEYLEDVEKILTKAEDVCLRDKKSVSLCKISNPRLAPDIIFSLDTSKYIPKTTKKEVIFSVIDCNKKSNQIKTTNLNNYENKIIEMINFFKNKGYSIKLMSFCKEEGDEIAVNNIYDKLKDKNKVTKYFYDGNIEEALTVIGQAELIVGTRFHANILGLIMNKTIIPIIYNDKTKNLLDDINFQGKIIDINNLNSFKVEDITDNHLNYKINISEHQQQASNHFSKLDKILEKRK